MGGYVWLGNTAGTDGGVLRVVLLAAMGPLLVASLAVPQAFGGDALVFGLAYLAVRALHIGAYARARPRRPAAARRRPAARVDDAARGAAARRRRARRAVPRRLLGAALDDRLRRPGRCAAEGWRVEPAHFAERHGLIIIIALGESIVALGVGAERLALEPASIVGALLGSRSPRRSGGRTSTSSRRSAERKLREADGAARGRDRARLVHLPAPADGGRHRRVRVRRRRRRSRTSTPTWPPSPAAALCGGVALYLLALSVFKRRNVGSFNRPRLVAAAVLAAFAPLATRSPALLALALVARATCALITYEAPATPRPASGSGTGSDSPRAWRSPQISARRASAAG